MEASLQWDGSGKCDCEHTGMADDRVYGAIFAEHVLVGAWEATLSEDYVRAIDAVVSIDDPDSARTEKELRTYLAA
ncbi:hypothetical protein E1956_18335 [Paraburkholderia pallida]|uniref:Uncharacterized protein n=2 Tax=Paraburkholderia pallida TaxID=2547399 RepID=A0A4P7CYU9_9BURK|nr:hypothetical protein E1956_18335 [Paraburkholderia pallida]